MKGRNTFAIIVLIIVLIAAGVYFYFHVTNPVNNSGVNATTTATSTTENKSGLQTYSNLKGAFTISYPGNWQVSESAPKGQADTFWSELSQKDGKTFVTISSPEDYMNGTNLGNVYLSVGASIHALNTCYEMPTNHTSDATSSKVSINGLQYTKIQMTEAGAGNRYKITSYREKVGKRCYAIETLVHYSPLSFFATSTGVTQFNTSEVESALDTMVQSFTFGFPKK